jgi:hypothetical protein
MDGPAPFQHRSVEMLRPVYNNVVKGVVERAQAADVHLRPE